MTKASKALLIFFWVAFAAFLSASIPHVAWFFSVFEPVNGPDGWLYWSVSYGIAISIDVTTFLLSMTVAGMAKQGKSKRLIFSVWVFILALACLSWFINGKYAIHFEQRGIIAASPVTIPLWVTDLHINDMNPIIASCFQILAVAYTWIADKIAAGEKPKTAAELQKEADELDALSVQKARIAARKRENLNASLSGVMDLGATLAKKGSSYFAKPKSAGEAILGEEDEETIEGEEEAVSMEVDTDELEAINATSKTTSQGDETGHQSGQTGPLNRDDITSQYPALMGLSGRATLPIEQVAQMVGSDIKYVQSLRSKGTLKHAAKSKDLITVASLKAYLATRRRPRQLRQPELVMLPSTGDEQAS